MKKLNILITLLCLGFAGIATAQSTANLTVTITNIKSTEGRIVVSIFNSKETFLGKHYMQQISAAETGSMEFEFKELPQGSYTISTYHDKNKNGELDKNFIGIPSEPYGISMEGKSNYGPPSYQKAVFSMDGKSKNLTIQL
jgi:uncharacterized protein (DUF2141 family)